MVFFLRIILDCPARILEQIMPQLQRFSDQLVAKCIDDMLSMDESSGTTDTTVCDRSIFPPVVVIR